MPTPQQAAAKWATRLKGASTEIRQGVEAVTDSPMEKAADNAEKWLNGVQQAYASGKFANRLRNTPISKWKTNTLDKGIQRIPAGVDNAISDVESFFAELLPFEESLSREIDNMPDVNLEDSINRMTAWARGMAEFQRS